MDEERRAMARMKLNNMPCYVHGRVGCPCSAMAYETNVSEGLDSLACFLGVDDDDEEEEEEEEEDARQHNVSVDFNNYSTPNIRPQSSSNLESPGGLSLPGVV